MIHYVVFLHIHWHIIINLNVSTIGRELRRAKQRIVSEDSGKIDWKWMGIWNQWIILLQSNARLTDVS